MISMGYIGEPLVRYIDSIAPSWCRYVSLYLKQWQIVDYTIPPGIWLVILAIVALVSFWAILISIRARRFGQGGPA